MSLRTLTSLLVLALALGLPAASAVDEEPPAASGGHIRQQGDATVELVTGSDSPLGGEHFRLRIGEAGEGEGASYAIISMDALTGVRLADLRELSYWTRVTTEHATKLHGYEEAPFVYLHLDEDNDGRRDETLVYEPTFNGDVLPDRWQYWDANRGFWHRPGSDIELSLGSYLEHFPEATIVSASLEEIPAAAFTALDKWDAFMGSIDGLRARVAGDDEPLALYDELEVFQAEAARAELEELEREADDLGEEAAQTWSETREELQPGLEEAEAELERFSGATTEGLEEVGQALRETLADLGRGLSEAGEALQAMARGEGTEGS